MTRHRRPLLARWTVLKCLGRRIQLGSGRAIGCRTPRLRLSVEIVAQVGVAVGGIVPQALVKLKRLIELTNPLARVADGRRVVRSGSRRLPQQGRTWEPTRRGRRWNETGATSRDLDVAFRRLAFRLFARIAPALTGSFRPLQPLHDDRRSLIHHDVRYRRAIEGLLLGRRRTPVQPRKRKKRGPTQRRKLSRAIISYRLGRYS